MNIILNGFKAILSPKSSRIWFIVTAAVLVLVIAINIVLTQVTLIFSTFNILFGGYRYELSGDFANPAYRRFTSDYDSKLDALAAANSFVEETLGEGIVLLKNDDNALPIATPESDSQVTAKPKISVFGKNSVSLVYGGSGSGGRSDQAEPNKTLYESLDSAGFEYNPDLVGFYNNNNASGKGRSENPRIGAGAVMGLATGETPYEDYPQSLKDTYTQYNDAAFVVLSRIGGEGFDLPRTMLDDDGKALPGTPEDPITGNKLVNNHYLQLDKNEIELLNNVCAEFSKVIIIINSATPMELGFLDGYSGEAGYNDNIKAAIWIATTGGTGAMAIGRILNGSVNPSGRTVDLYARNFKTDPTWNNFSTNMVDKGDQYYLEGTSQRDSNQVAAFVRYEEGIYVGYRYYETRYITEAQKTGDLYDGQKWYEENVVYPFGYGKSYTTFAWSNVSSIPSDSVLSKAFVTNKDSKITLTVNVKNTGNYPGKDVVQVYATAPYYHDGIEKAHKVLVGFTKTPMLYPASQAGPDKPNSLSVEVTVDPYILASYDYLGLNSTGVSGYVLEHGDYHLTVSQNSHDEAEAIVYTVEEDILFETDTVTGYDVENRFDDVSDEIETYLSRADWDATETKTPQQRDYGAKSQAWFDSYYDYSSNLSYDIGKPWYTPAAQMPEHQEKALSKAATEVKLYELIGKDYNDELWDTLVSQLSISQMAALIGQGAFQTIMINNIGKPECLDYDGPAGFNLFMTTVPDINVAYYPSACVIAATWNAEIARKMGEIVGNEGLWGRQESNFIRAYSGWYAPGINIHRSPFSGRNFEYYSQDAFLSGIMAGNVVSGAQAKGVYTFIKHFAVNDQETHRDFGGLATWLSEQSMREIYLKPFEIAVKMANADAKKNGKQPIVSMMSSFNRLGTEWAGSSYNLLTEVLRNEWGFKGMVISDFNTGAAFMNADRMIRAGGDLNLCQNIPPKSSGDAITSTHVASLQRATKAILFTVANSNAMNGFGEGVDIVQKLPVWTVIMILIDVAIVVGLGVWGFFVIRKVLKKQKSVATE